MMHLDALKILEWIGLLKASNRLADDRFNDSILLFIGEVIEEWQAHQLIADALSYRAITRLSAKAHAHIRKVQGQVMEHG